MISGFGPHFLIYSSDQKHELLKKMTLDLIKQFFDPVKAKTELTFEGDMSYCSNERNIKHIFSGTNMGTHLVTERLFGKKELSPSLLMISIASLITGESFSLSV